MDRLTPKKVWDEYLKGVDYNTAIDLYENVKRNENFYIGKQWEGVNAPDLPKPTMNILKRVVSYFIAMIVSDDITVSITPFTPDPDKEKTCQLVCQEIEKVMEQDKVKQKNRELLRNAAVDGDACLYLWFDPDAETGQQATGRIRTEIIENINVLFGNPYSADVQSQRSIIIVQRKTVEDVKDEAKQYGGEVDNVKSDSDERQGEKNDNSSLCTVLIRMWREKGTIWCQKTTENAVVRKAWDTGYKLYPIAYMTWDKIRSSCHGQACITGLIPNQIAVNKLFAMAVRSVELNAFPKVIYDKTKIARWDNTVGAAIGVTGDVSQAAVTSFKVQDMSGQVMDCIDRSVSMTRDFMGASDAALGNVRPDNTSAIIAVQQASAVPLELNKLNFYQFVEDYIRVMVDIMRNNYGIRTLINTVIDPMTGDSVQAMAQVDYSILDDPELDLNVDIGPSAYWSEQSQIQTLDNLFASGVVTDKALYLESIPDKYVPNKANLLKAVKVAQQQEQQMQQMQEMMQMQQTPTPLDTMSEEII